MGHSDRNFLLQSNRLWELLRNFSNPLHLAAVAVRRLATHLGSTSIGDLTSILLRSVGISWRRYRNQWSWRRFIFRMVGERRSKHHLQTKIHSQLCPGFFGEFYPDSLFFGRSTRLGGRPTNIGIFPAHALSCCLSRPGLSGIQQRLHPFFWKCYRSGIELVVYRAHGCHTA